MPKPTRVQKVPPQEFNTKEEQHRKYTQLIVNISEKYNNKELLKLKELKSIIPLHEISVNDQNPFFTVEKNNGIIMILNVEQLDELLK
jgi:hypothetical protein